MWSIHTAAEQGDFSAMAGMAHKLKSSASTVGAMVLSGLCEQLEVASRIQNHDACITLAAGMHTAFGDAKAKIRLHVDFLGNAYVERVD